MRAKLVGLNKFRNFDDDEDTNTLLKEIKSISCKYKGRRNLHLALSNAQEKMYLYYQKPQQSNTLHYNTFHAFVEAVEHHGWTLCRGRALIEIEIKQMNNDYDLSVANMVLCTQVEAIVRNKGLVIAFFKQSGRNYHSVLLDNLENYFSLSTDPYPIDFPSALTILECYVKPVTPHNSGHY